jgi:hypothetical protein
MGGALALDAYDDIFNTTAPIADMPGERVIEAGLFFLK